MLQVPSIKHKHDDMAAVAIDPTASLDDDDAAADAVAAAVPPGAASADFQCSDGALRGILQARPPTATETDSVLLPDCMQDSAQPALASGAAPTSIMLREPCRLALLLQTRPLKQQQTQHRMLGRQSAPATM